MADLSLQKYHGLQMPFLWQYQYNNCIPAGLGQPKLFNDDRIYAVVLGGDEMGFRILGSLR